jgi:hypothetical protein
MGREGERVREREEREGGREGERWRVALGGEREREWRGRMPYQHRQQETWR